MSSSQGGAISSLVYSSSAVTAASMGYVFGRPAKVRKQKNQIKLSMNNNNSNNNYSNNNNNNDNNIFKTTSSMSSSTPKSPLKRFKLFRSKSKRSKISSSKYILPPKTVHPRVVHPNQLADDDVSSIYSDATSVYTIMNDRDRRTLSVPNLPATIQQWDNSPTMTPTSAAFVPRNVTEIPEEEEGEEEDWDTQSDSGYNETFTKSARMSSPTLPISINSNNNPSKRHYRCKSLPPTPINLQDFPPSLYNRQPTPSEVWDEDEDFDLENTSVLNVPSSVEESQISLRMDISNIRDFISHIGKLKDLREKKEKLCSTIHSRMNKKWTNGFLRTTKVKYLENMFKQDWEEANVIIDIADVAQDNETTFRGGKRVEVDIERISSERHMKIFKRIVIESLGDDFDGFDSFDDDKENQYDYNIPSKNIAKKLSSCIKKSDVYGEKRRLDDIKVSLEIMPSLIEHLEKLQKRLNDHIHELGKVDVDHNTV